MIEIGALPVKPKSKKDRIFELLSSGNHSAQDIARIVGTTPANVWKEKSRSKSGRTLVSRKKTVELSTKKTSDEMIMVSADARRSRSDNNYNRFLDIPQLDTEGVKRLYSEFRTGKKPIDIIADNGFHPEVVAEEYNRYLQFNSLDIGSLQKRYISSIMNYPIPKAQPLFKDYQAKGYLTVDEFLELLNHKSVFDRECGMSEAREQDESETIEEAFDRVVKNQKLKSEYDQFDP